MIIFFYTPEKKYCNLLKKCGRTKSSYTRIDNGPEEIIFFGAQFLKRLKSPAFFARSGSKLTF